MPAGSFVQVNRSDDLRGSVAEVLEASWQVANQTEQDVEGTRLHVPSRFPSRNRVGAQAQDVSQLGLSDGMVLAERADLVSRQEVVLLSILRDRVFLESASLGVREYLLPTLRTFGVRSLRDGDLLSID